MGGDLDFFVKTYTTLLVLTRFMNKHTINCIKIPSPVIPLNKNFLQWWMRNFQST